jgi:hypothetical protein
MSASCSTTPIASNERPTFSVERRKPSRKARYAAAAMA